jgi:DNA polymerase III epsilon subunit-like protein
MRVLVFDTETTGLPETRVINPEALHLWPYIVQFSYVIYDTDLNEMVECKNYIIKVKEGVNISEDSVKFHGITNEISKAKGIPVEEVLNEFFFYLRNCDKLVGHNVSFDINIVKIELLRMVHLNKKKFSEEEIKEIKWNLHYFSNYKPIYCTLQESIELCSIPAVNKSGKTYFKYPKLVELHEKLFKTIPNGLHNSLNDILVTLRCYVKMVENKDLNNCCNTFKEIAEEIEIY